MHQAKRLLLTDQINVYGFHDDAHGLKIVLIIASTRQYKIFMWHNADDPWSYFGKRRRQRHFFLRETDSVLYHVSDSYRKMYHAH